MSEIKARSSAPLIKVLLRDPSLPERVRNASAPELIRWIDEIGLEDSGEVIAFANTQQIEAIFDEDLWKPIKMGEDEKFDADRFGAWLEILSEIGLDKAVEKIVEMDEEFLVMAFSTLVWVAEADWLEGNCEANPRIEKIIESRLTFEIDNYILFGKSEQSWDIFISLIAAMDTYHHSFLYRILDRCFNFLSQEAATEDDLYEILSDEEQVVDDVAYEREKRREAQGFVTPAIARSFLKLCDMSLDVEDHVAPKHLLLKKLSASDEVVKGHSKDLVPGSHTKYKNVKAIFEKYPKQNNLFMEQINFLANSLMSGWDWKNEERRPGRALEMVLEICEEGLKDSSEEFSSFLRSFRIGWRKNKRT
ncbi:MAG: hypothetical protein COT73_04755 [Bdellovibrio sp. CG10_big_fil_rev_8_21_14_0_10_47_8]|nr:MAG: hypothetical protein COT73_04755 [Bdellovibrio sp. CG10_big_fil_rev_8_21_14_0_10_47_8]